VVWSARIAGDKKKRTDYALLLPNALNTFEPGTHDREISFAPLCCRFYPTGRSSQHPSAEGSRL
jgi:hypothetical protein